MREIIIWSIVWNFRSFHVQTEHVTELSNEIAPIPDGRSDLLDSTGELLVYISVEDGRRHFEL